MKPHPRTAERYSLDEGGRTCANIDTKLNWFKLNSDPKVARYAAAYFESDKAQGSKTDSETISSYSGTDGD